MAFFKWDQLKPIAKGANGIVFGARAVACDATGSSIELALKLITDQGDAVVEQTMARAVSSLGLPSFLEYYGTLMIPSHLVPANMNNDTSLSSSSSSSSSDCRFLEYMATCPAYHARLKKKNPTDDPSATTLVFLFMEKAVTGSAMMNELGKEYPKDRAVREWLSSLLASVATAQQQLGFWHGDIHAFNIVWRNRSLPTHATQYTPALVDFGNASLPESPNDICGRGKGKRTTDDENGHMGFFPCPNSLFGHHKDHSTDVFHLGLVALTWMMDSTDSRVFERLFEPTPDYLALLRVHLKQMPLPRYFRSASHGEVHFSRFCGYLTLWRGLGFVEWPTTPDLNMGITFKPMAGERMSARLVTSRMAKHLRENVIFASLMQMHWETTARTRVDEALAHILSVHGPDAMLVLRALLHPDPRHRGFSAKSIRRHGHLASLLIHSPYFSATAATTTTSSTSSRKRKRDDADDEPMISETTLRTLRIMRAEHKELRAAADITSLEQVDEYITDTILTKCIIKGTTQKRRRIDPSPLVLE